MPEDDACAGGHAQSASPAAAPQAGSTALQAGSTAPQAGSSYQLLHAVRGARPATALAHAPSTTAGPASALAKPALAPAAFRQLVAPHVHISGFDPRAAGGRQTLKLELRGMPASCAPQVGMVLRSELFGSGTARQEFARSARGDWHPVFIEFSSRNKEHGQYQISVEMLSLVAGVAQQKWICTFVILVPRPDATLTEIHHIFLNTHKNVRVVADDASIARVSAQAGNSFDLDVTARNAGIAHVELSAPQGKVDLGFSTIAWDEDLLEVDLPGASHSHPHPSRAACLVNAAPEAGAQRHIRLFALEECVLGRFELVDPESDVLLSHFGDDGQDNGGLTRRLSGRHAIIRRAGKGFEIEDVSRYGILLDGVWPGKHKPTTLRLGMRIEFSASIKGIVVLSVSAIMPHGVIMHRIDQGAQAECFYLLAQDKHPGFPMPTFVAAPNAAALPLLFHHDGGFWHLDQLSGKETALAPAAALDKLSRIPRHHRFAAEPYPECWIIRTGAAGLHETIAPQAMADA